MAKVPGLQSRILRMKTSGQSQPRGAAISPCPRTPPIPYPTPMPTCTRLLPTIRRSCEGRRTSTTLGPNLRTGTTPQAEAAEPAPAKAGGMPCLFHTPLSSGPNRACDEPSVVPRLSHAAFVSYLRRAVPTRVRESTPKLPPEPLRRIRDSSPSCAQPCRASTSIQPQSYIGPRRRVARHGGAGKKRGERDESNRIAAARATGRLQRRPACGGRRRPPRRRPRGQP